MASKRRQSENGKTEKRKKKSCEEPPELCAAVTDEQVRAAVKEAWSRGTSFTLGGWTGAAAPLGPTRPQDPGHMWALHLGAYVLAFSHVWLEPNILLIPTQQRIHGVLKLKWITCTLPDSCCDGGALGGYDLCGRFCSFTIVP